MPSTLRPQVALREAKSRVSTSLGSGRPASEAVRLWASRAETPESTPCTPRVPPRVRPSCEAVWESITVQPAPESRMTERRWPLAATAFSQTKSWAISQRASTAAELPAERLIKVARDRMDDNNFRTPAPLASAVLDAPISRVSSGTTEESLPNLLGNLPFLAQEKKAPRVRSLPP